ncbi:hypothetical protein CR513_21931, partial [Mucuna pruriens]
MLATIVDDSGAVGFGAVLDLGDGGVEANKTVIFGLVVSALKHSICQGISSCLICCAKVLVIILNLSSHIRKEVTQARSVVIAASTVY